MASDFWQIIIDIQLTEKKMSRFPCRPPDSLFTIFGNNPFSLYLVNQHFLHKHALKGRQSLSQGRLTSGEASTLQIKPKPHGT